MENVRVNNLITGVTALAATVVFFAFINKSAARKPQRRGKYRKEGSNLYVLEKKRT